MMTMMNETMNLTIINMDELSQVAGGKVFDEEETQRFLRAMISRFMAEVLTLTDKNQADPFYILLAQTLEKKRITIYDICAIDRAIYTVSYDNSFFRRYIWLMKQEATE